MKVFGVTLFNATFAYQFCVVRVS